jgi:hypothetical protein
MSEKKDGDNPPIDVLFRPRNHVGDDTWIHELAERLADALLEAQLLDHAVEGGCQGADLVP